jgi:hypothetical protein
VSLTCLDPGKYHKVINDWAQHKALPLIRCGISKACSKIRPEVWDNIIHHTNAVEQTHHKGYSFGKRLSLMQAIDMFVNCPEHVWNTLTFFSGHLMDTRDIDILQNFLQHGVRHGYAAQNLSERYKRGRARYGIYKKHLA